MPKFLHETSADVCVDKYRYEPSSFIGELGEDLNSPEVDFYQVSFVVVVNEPIGETSADVRVEK